MASCFAAAVGKHRLPISGRTDSHIHIDQHLYSDRYTNGYVHTNVNRNASANLHTHPDRNTNRYQHTHHRAITDHFANRVDHADAGGAICI